MAATINVADWSGMQAAINGAAAGDTILLAAGTYTATSGLSINKAVTVDGGGSTVNVSGSGWYVVNITAAGTLTNLNLVKTDKTGVHNLVGINASNVTVSNCTFTGQYVLGDGEVTRAFEAAYGSQNLLITGNTITGLRQPGYFNGSAGSPTTGTISNNHVAGTRGWVMAGAKMTFTGNTWAGNAVDIAILDGTPFGAPYDPLASLRANNNNAVISDQRSGTNPYRVDNLTQGLAYTTIQAAISAANAGDTIKCAAGTYAESVSLNKAITLQGANAGIHAANGTGTAPGGRGAESIVTGSFNPAADNVTVDGFTFTKTGGRVVDTYANASNFHLTNCIFADVAGHSGGGVIQFGGGIHNNVTLDYNLFQQASGEDFFYTGGTPWANLVVSHNDFIGDGDNGIFQTSTGMTNTQVTNNYFSGYGTAFNMGALDNPTITNNTCDGTYMGFQIGTHGGTVSNNTFTDLIGWDYGSYQWGPAIDLFGGQWGTWTCEDLQVTNNTVTNSSVGIYVRGGVGGAAGHAAAVKNNNLTNCTFAGIWVRLSGGIGDLQTVEVADNSISGGAAANDTGLMLSGVAGDDLDIGSTSFGSDLAWFVRLADFGGAGTTVNVDAATASFDGASDDAAKEAKVWHDVDDAALGHVDWGQGAATAAALAVSPASGSVGQTVQLMAKLTAGGNPLAGQPVSFTVGGAAAGSGTTDAAGVAVASYAIATGGDKAIVASFVGVSNYKAATGTNTLSVAAAAPTALTLTPNPTTVTSGAVVTYTVMGDNGVNYTSQCTFYTSNAAGGSWNGSAYTTAKAGTWTVTAVYNTLTATAALTVNHGAATGLSLTPADATVVAGATQAYVATATDAAGNSFTDGIALAENGAGSLTGNVYTSLAGDAGNDVTITATCGAQSATATLHVQSADGPGNVLAWDKDTRKFYLCSNPANPQTGTEITGTGTFNGIAVVVSGTSTNLTVTVPATGSALRMQWYLRGTALYRVYEYSTIGAVSRTAQYDGTRTYVDGAWKAGFWGLAHTLSGSTATYGNAAQ